MQRHNFKCIQCGCCCREFVICISYSDITRWAKEKRKDILKETVFAKDAPQGDGFYFEHTIIAPKQSCVFLTKDNLCSIHKTKPRCCKDAPYGFKEFSICPVWEKSKHFNENRFKKVRARQDKDYKRCVQNFQELLDITFKARGFKHWQLIMDI